MLRTLCVTVSITIFAWISPSVSVKAEDSQAALRLIRETAVDICQSVPLATSKENVELTGDAKAKLGGAIGKIANLGVEGAAKYEVGQSQGILQQDLAAAIKNGNDCRLAVFNTLSTKLLPIASNSKDQPPSTPDNGSLAHLPKGPPTSSIDLYMECCGGFPMGTHTVDLYQCSPRGESIFCVLRLTRLDKSDVQYETPKAITLWGAVLVDNYQKRHDLMRKYFINGLGEEQNETYLGKGDSSYVGMEFNRDGVVGLTRAKIIISGRSLSGPIR
jgi:hypothetical protein